MNHLHWLTDEELRSLPYTATTVRPGNPAVLIEVQTSRVPGLIDTTALERIYREIHGPNTIVETR